MFEDQKAIYFTFFIYTFTSLQEKKEQRDNAWNMLLRHLQYNRKSTIGRKRETIKDVQISKSDIQLSTLICGKPF